MNEYLGDVEDIGVNAVDLEVHQNSLAASLHASKSKIYSFVDIHNTSSELKNSTGSMQANDDKNEVSLKKQSITGVKKPKITPGMRLKKAMQVIYWGVKSTRRVFNAFHHVQAAIQRAEQAKLIEVPIAAQHRFSFNLTEYQTHTTRFSPENIKKIIEIDPDERTGLEDLQLVHLLDRVKFFAKYSYQIRLKLSKVLEYRCWGPNREIVKQGYPARSFYFLLKGAAVATTQEEDKDDKVTSQTIHELKEGDSFGENSLLRNVKRAATICTIKESEFLTIDKDDFQQIFKSIYEENQQKLMNILESITLLSKIPKAMLMTMSSHCTIRDYSQGTVLADEKQPIDELFFIVTGSCSVYKELTLVKTVEPGRRFSYKPITNIPLKSNEQLVNKTVKITTLGKFEYFGEDDIFALTRRQALNLVFQKEQVHTNWTVVSDTKVECLCISKIDFVRSINEEYYSTFKDFFKPYPPEDAIVDSFFVNHNWNLLKKKVVHEIITGKEERKLERARLAFR